MASRYRRPVDRANRSEYLDRLAETVMIGTDQKVHHYLIANNEDEWCEIVAGSYNIHITT